MLLLVLQTESGGGDVTAPTLASATIAANGTDLVLVFDEAVTSDYTGFTLSGKTLNAAGGSGSGTDTITIPITTTVGSHETGFTLDYDQGTGNVADGSSNVLISFADEAVTNNSTQDTIAPTLQTVRFIQGGTKIRFTFSEDVTGTTGITVDSGTIAYESGDGTRYHIYEVTSGTPTTVSYTQAGGDIVDDGANELEEFTNEPITAGGDVSITLARPVAEAVASAIARGLGG